jgi:subtilisin family serine protease
MIVAPRKLFLSAAVVGVFLLYTQAALAARRVYPGVIVTTRRSAAGEAAALLSSNPTITAKSLPSRRISPHSLLVSDWRNRQDRKSLPEPVLYERRANLCKLAKVRRVLSASRGKLVCEPDWEISALRTLPNDPNFSSLSGLDRGSGVDINAPEAWDVTTGSSNVVVAVIDTGIDYSHPDLAANAGVNGFFGMDYVNNDSDPMDDNSHGTHCSGTVGGVGNNGVGVTGVNWQVRLLGMKFLSASGSGSTSGAVSAINFLVTYNQTTLAPQGKKLITSNSWGGGGPSTSLFNAISSASAGGILFIAAAGNEATDTDVTANFPSNYDLPNVVSVAAVSSTGALASFSNFGATSVDLAAPGVGILSTIPGNQYASYNGTSMATPHVAGVAALVYAACPTATMAQVKTALFQTRALSALSGKTVTGGMLDAQAAVSYILSVCSNAPTPTPASTPTPIVSVTPTTAAPTAVPTEIAPTPTEIPTAPPEPSPTSTPTATATSTSVPNPAPPDPSPTSIPTAVPANFTVVSPSVAAPGALFTLGVKATASGAVRVQFVLDGLACPSTFTYPTNTLNGATLQGRFLLSRNSRFFSTMTASATSTSQQVLRRIGIRGGRSVRSQAPLLRSACPRLVGATVEARPKRR